MFGHLHRKVVTERKFRKLYPLCSLIPLLGLLVLLKVQYLMLYVKTDDEKESVTMSLAQDLI